LVIDQLIIFIHLKNQTDWHDRLFLDLPYGFCYT